MDYAVFFIVFIIGIPTFFILRWVLKKGIHSKKERVIATWAGTIILSPLIYIGLVMLFLFIVSYYPSREFDKERWVSAPDKRYELTEDLIESKLLYGKTKSEVQLLLGKPDHEQDNVWSYYIGYVPSLFEIDPDGILIQFKNEKVVHAEQSNSKTFR